jgi:hypothetical protein
MAAAEVGAPLLCRLGGPMPLPLCSRIALLVTAGEVGDSPLVNSSGSW